MTARTEGRRATPMMEHAGPQLYRRNAFRITGLATDADRRAVSHRRQQLTTVLAVRDHVDPAGPVPLPEPAGVLEVRAAFADLDDPRARLAHELFWLWGGPTDCGCPADLHKRHDEAVRRHALALDAELAADTPEAERKRRWQTAIRGWNALLAEPTLWHHLRHRIRRIDDPRLDHTAVRQLRTALPRVLVTSSVETAMATAGNDRTRLLALLDDWQVDAELVEEVTRRVVEPLLAKAEAGIDQAHRLLSDDKPKRAGRVVLKELRPVLADLRALAPPDRHRATARVMDQAAIVLANSAVKLLDGGVGSGRDAADRLHTTGRKFLQRAASLATRDDTRDGIASLRSQLEVVSAARGRIHGDEAELQFLPGLRWQLPVVWMLAFGAVLGVAYPFGLAGSWCTVVTAVAVGFLAMLMWAGHRTTPAQREVDE